MIKAQLVLFVVLLVGLAVGLPLKEREIDELIYRLQELKHQNGLASQKAGHPDSKHPMVERPRKNTDLDVNPLVYDYYANGIAPTYNDDINHRPNLHKRFDEIDRIGFNNFNRRVPKSSFTKREFDEIDRNGFDSFYKRNFDEIDRIGF